ncbi:unnamed protein product [Prorocentrum cordatum]|uniref:Ion transport domain-containing protein n=1 Tax=Prorocentrum cordatum TaxID=2364126 RepID=A0ABN9SXR0_9DINO|nr:unnamed protein product [Polarella glacialis]
MARRGAALSEEGEAEAALRGQVQDVWRQEQKVQRELREMQREQDAILQALRELRSHRYIGAGAAGHAADAGDSSSHAGSQARRARRSCTAQNMDGTSSVTSAANLRSPTRSKVPVNGYSEGYTKSVTTTNTGRVAAQRDTIARQSLYQTGRNMKDHELHAMYFGTDGTRTLGVWEESSSFLKKGASRMRKCCKGMSRSPWFDAVVGIVIVLNTICIGMSIQWELEGRDVSTLDIAESTFLTFYVAELIIRLIAWGRSCFNSPWFIFDFVLVSFGVFSDWVLSPLLARMETGSQLGILEQVLIVRILRLLRLVRALRAMELFKDMWKLVRGMLGSARTVTSACLLIFGSLYIFGCIGVELLTQDEVLRDDPRTAFIMKKYFSSLSNVILTLVQFSNYDSIAAIYVPIVKVRPVMCIYFVIIILVVPVCLMNLRGLVDCRNSRACYRECKDGRRHSTKRDAEAPDRVETPDQASVPAP